VIPVKLYGGGAIDKNPARNLAATIGVQEKIGLWGKLAYPLSMLCAMASGWLALEAGTRPFVIFGVVSVVTLIFVIAGEVLRTHNRDWRPRFKDNYYPDVTTLVLNNFLLQSPVLQLVIAGTALSLSGGGLEIWPHHWPLVLQAILALVLGEFGAYWWHRSTHEIPLLWRFHKVHHCPSRLYWLNATKFHYLDMTLLQSFTVLPALMLGANESAVLFITLFSIFHGYWQHGNTQQSLGILNYLFSTAQLHRWHHNQNPAVANHNFGSNLIFWDLVFGTYFWPEGGHGDAVGAHINHIGIADDDYPQDPFRHFVQPFTRKG
jgi:sterol desaturase/sphingolipid hydroxylase (fatty acid hydroxylase superfamily)